MNIEYLRTASLRALGSVRSTSRKPVDLLYRNHQRIHHEKPLDNIYNTMLYALSALLSVLCPLPSVLCYLSSVLCPLFSALCSLSSVLCHLSSAICPLSSDL